MNAGILVNIANPKNTPERKTIRFLTVRLFESLEYIANNIDDKRKGVRIDSKSILLKNHVIGITANKIDAKSATFLPYLRSDILKMRKVSTTASIPINTLGTRYTICINCKLF